MKKLLPLDFMIFALVLFSGILFTARLSSAKGNVVQVQAKGITYQFSLDKDGIYSVDGEIGKTVFEIKDGKVKIIDSPCPNKTCMNQLNSSPLVCLPNKVIITIENYGEFDAVSE